MIGVVLAGVSLGNYLGGRLADARPTARRSPCLRRGLLASLAILGLVHYLDSLLLPNSAPAMAQVLWLTALLFFVPSTVLAAATPVLTRLSLHSVDEGGRVVGRIQAAAALGPILGTFLTGFVLISAFGTRRIVAGVAVTLLLLAFAARLSWLARGPLRLPFPPPTARAGSRTIARRAKRPRGDGEQEQRQRDPRDDPPRPEGGDQHEAGQERADDAAGRRRRLDRPTTRPPSSTA